MRVIITMDGTAAHIGDEQQSSFFEGKLTHVYDQADDLDMLLSTTELQSILHHVSFEWVMNFLPKFYMPIAIHKRSPMPIVTAFRFRDCKTLGNSNRNTVHGFQPLSIQPVSTALYMIWSEERQRSLPPSETNCTQANEHTLVKHELELLYSVPA